jgi:spore germination cell wall hydrolase CwlJ-like protein
MTAPAQRLHTTELRLKLIGGAIIALLMLSVLAAALLIARDRADASTVNVKLASSKAAQLIEATSGAKANDFEAIGDQAKVINAALPFAGGPIRAAQPFAITGSDLDERRALLCMTQAVYYEAGFEPVEGRRAVAQVVLNRMRHPAFPKSVCGVVYQGAGTGVCQFSFVCDGALYRAPARDAWARAEDIARQALDGYVETAVGEATHYHADYVAPRWAPMLSKVAQIGQHIFYRWPGAWGQPAAFTGRYIGEPRDPLSMRPAKPTVEAIPGMPVVESPEGPITDGTVLKRAPDDVGGLLDPSKGWTLSIPDPTTDPQGSAAKLIATQETTAKPATAAAASVPGATQVASR